MIISEKLYQLRTKSGLSQEELAEKVNVSRQSISKWESGSSIPSIDKVLELSRVYGVSTDFLLNDELEEMPTEVIVGSSKQDTSRKISVETVNEYLLAVGDAARKIALGVMLCIASFIPIFILEGLSTGEKVPLNEDVAGGIGVAVMFLAIAVAVLLFIQNAMKLKPYDYLNKEIFTLDYGVEGIAEKKEKENRPAFIKGLSTGVALCIASIIPLVAVAGFSDSDEIILYTVAIMFLLIAIGVYLIVSSAIQKNAFSKLLQKNEYDEINKKNKKKLDVFSDAYWCIMTAVYIGISFLTKRWDMTWIIWPVSALVFVALYSLLKSKFNKNH